MYNRALCCKRIRCVMIALDRYSEYADAINSVLSRFLKLFTCSGMNAKRLSSKLLAQRC